MFTRGHSAQASALLTRPPGPLRTSLCSWLLALVLRVGRGAFPCRVMGVGLPALCRAGLRLRCPGGVSFGGTLPSRCFTCLRGLRLGALSGLGRPLLWLGLPSLPQGPSGGGAGRVLIRQCLVPPSAVASLGAPCASWCGWLAHAIAKVVREGGCLSAWGALLRGFAV